MAEKNRCPQCGNELPADAPQEPCPQCLMKLGLPTGTEADKAGASKPASDVPTSATPPGGCVPPAPAELAKQFPQLDIIELLGQGGMGAVYKARQKQLDRLVALKILPPEVGRTEAFAERFTREARSLAKLSHPRIVSVHDFGHTEDGLYYFIMEFIDGTDLRHVIQAGELSAAEALAIVPQVCEGLQFAHEEGIVHRDIKPENILIDKKGRVKIADFGLAKLLDRPASLYTLTGAGQRMGTPHYMAPEQIEHPSQVDHRADIFSLGVVFYEMLTGELPLGRFAPPSQKVQVDVRLDKVVLHSLEKEPERRYQHASEVKTDVEIISSGSKPARSNVAPGENTEAVRRRLRIPAIGLMISGAVNLPLVLPLVLGVWSTLNVTSSIGLVVMVMAFECVVGLVIILGAWKMLRLRSYGWAVVCSVLAVLPLSVGFMLGFPMGVWALIVLYRSDVQEAFASRKKEQAAQTEPNRRGLLIGLVVAGIAIVMMVLLTLPIIFGWPVIVRSTSNRQSPLISVESYSGSERAGQLDLPYGTPEDLTFGPEGPTLSDECIRILELEPSEAAQVHKILRRAYRQYLELERRNTQQYRKVNSLTVIISPFHQEAKSFLKQLWADLDSILDEQKRTLVRRHLPLGQMFGTFQFGGPTVTISVSKEKGMFSYYTTYKWPKGSGKSGKGTSKGGGSTLPPKYRRFWEEPATDK